VADGLPLQAVPSRATTISAAEIRAAASDARDAWRTTRMKVVNISSSVVVAAVFADAIAQNSTVLARSGVQQM
jgi:hypothetical protein